MTDPNETRVTDRRKFLTVMTGVTATLAGCSSDSSDANATSATDNRSTNASSTDSSSDTSPAGPPDPDGSRNTGPVDGIERAYAIPDAVPIGIDGDRVITRTSVDGEPALAGFNYLTGERLWNRSIGSYDTPAITASGQIGHGRLYNIGSEDDEDRYINVIDLATGDLLGTHEFESGYPSRLVPLNGGAFFLTGNALDYTGFYVNGETAERESAFSPSDVWNLGQESPTLRGASRSALHTLTGDGMYVSGRRITGAEFRYGDTEPRESIAVRASTSTNGIPRPSSESAVFGSRVDSYGDDPPARARSREDGSLLWERSDNYYIPPYGYGGDTLAYLGADEGERVIGVEPSNGDIRWERTDLDLPTGDFNTVNAPYAVTDRALVVGASNGIKLLGLADGATVARSEDTAFSSFLTTQSRVLTTGTVTTEGEETNGMIVYEY